MSERASEGGRQGGKKGGGGREGGREGGRGERPGERIKPLACSESESSFCENDPYDAPKTATSSTTKNKCLLY